MRVYDSANLSVDLKELALQVTTDPDHQFDLSLQLDDLDTAVKIARSVLEPEAETKWKAIGDRALTVWRFDLAREAFEKAGDLSALMLLLLSTGDREGLQKLAATAEKKGANNLAFATLFQLGDAKPCVDLLVKTNRAPEAALFARTYAPRCVHPSVDVMLDANSGAAKYPRWSTYGETSCGLKIRARSQGASHTHLSMQSYLRKGGKRLLHARLVGL